MALPDCPLDYDEVFGALARDCGLRYHEIRDLTPRQTFDHYFRPRDPETGQVEPLEGMEPVEPMPASTASAVPADNAAWAPGMPRGLGLERYECWRRYPGERPGDPFSLPREVQKDRWYAMAFELCQRHLLEGIDADTVEGPKRYFVRKGDMDALRDFQDETWRLNCKRFERTSQEQAAREAAAAAEAEVAAWDGTLRATEGNGHAE